MHKRIAMGGESEANHLKKGGKVKKFAAGGSVGAYPESKVATLPAKGTKPHIDTNAGKTKIATMKKGGGAKKPGLMIAIAVGRKSSSRGR
jgi:hypothetical protein